MKHTEKIAARQMRSQGYALNYIAKQLHVSKSSVSRWVSDTILSPQQLQQLAGKPYTNQAVEKRRQARLSSEKIKRDHTISYAAKDISKLNLYQLKLIGAMLYWAEGGKTQRIVRFSNGDPRMISIMMLFFRKVCNVNENKFRGYIHIHPHLNTKKAEEYWSEISGIPRKQFYKTYRKQNKSSKNKKDTLPYGVLDIYILDVELFLKITGWSTRIFDISNTSIENIPGKPQLASLIKK